MDRQCHLLAKEGEESARMAHRSERHGAKKRRAENTGKERNRRSVFGDKYASSRAEEEDHPA